MVSTSFFETNWSSPDFLTYSELFLSRSTFWKKHHRAKIARGIRRPLIYGQMSRAHLSFRRSIRIRDVELVDILSCSSFFFFFNCSWFTIQLQCSCISFRYRFFSIIGITRYWVWFQVLLQPFVQFSHQRVKGRNDLPSHFTKEKPGSVTCPRSYQE